MTIEFYVREIYGTALCYIKNEYQRKMLQNITGRKTVYRTDMTSLTELTKGYIQWKEVLL